jgi:hypothetical protein
VNHHLLESAPASCALTNSSDGRYLVRHVPAAYYLDVRRDGARSAVPMAGLRLVPAAPRR